MILLGSGHDLSARVLRLGKGEVEYVRVLTDSYSGLAGKWRGGKGTGTFLLRGE